MARFLVTGGAGFMGSHLVDSLLKQGHLVRVLDDLSNGKRENLPQEIHFLQGDVTDPRAVEEAFEDIDACFHLAAIASVEQSNREWLRTHKVNLAGTLNILNQARRFRHCRQIPVVYASSAAVYGDRAAVPINEDTRVEPLSAYGADKAACKLHARVAGEVHSIPTVGLRFFNLYGSRQDGRSPYSGVITLFAIEWRGASPSQFSATEIRSAISLMSADAVAALTVEP